MVTYPNKDQLIRYIEQPKEDL
ncbi:hypothetical protein CCACVL1_24675 [Corchorus capsularis]|uniref:Uncharacterized protein n=1 Tax=Corchorus capsularis TaxID=210143 RepID=A0A1R3GNN3_COCAP|nr:hypothetical protein CCACVL1_24675 [Corchorus capsularis]